MNGALEKAVDFQENHLVKWIQSYVDSPITSNEDLCNGLLLNNVLNIIDPTVFSILRLQKNNVHDTTTRSQNLAEILHGIKRFYQEKLQQLIVMKMPDILMLAKEPNNECSHQEMQQILLLILGCAIQCDKKETFIEQIKELDVEVQRGLVASIQQVTENPENILHIRSNELNEMTHDELLGLSENLYYQIQRVLDQRDEYVETILDLALFEGNNDDVDDIPETPRVRSRLSLSPKTSFRSSNILQANRQRLQSLQSELDDRMAIASELKEEVEQLKLQLENVRIENKKLVSEAGWAKSLRDELDIVKSQLEQSNRYKQDNTKLKEKVRDIEYYKRQYEEMKEQSELLYESKLALEEKVAGSTSKMSRYSQYQEDNEKLFAQVKELMQERLEDQQRIKDLVDEVAKLSIEKQESMSAYTGLNAELDGLRLQKQDDGLNVPLLVEYNQSTSTEVLRLERENEQLKSTIEILQTSSSDPNASASRLHDLEENNYHLSESNLQYKNMISKLTKALLLVDGLNIEGEKLKSLLAERSSNRVLNELVEKQSGNIENLKGSLTRTSSELEQTNLELEELAEELAKHGVTIEIETLKEAIDLNTYDDESPTKKKPSYSHNNNTITLQQRCKRAEDTSRECQEKLVEKDNAFHELERKFEKKITENKSLTQNLVIQNDKVSALEERVSHLMSSANEDTRKINKTLEEKMKKISSLETRILEMKEEVKNHEQTRELLKLKDEKNSKLQEINKKYEEKSREDELRNEKTTNLCRSLEHMIKLRDEKIEALEASLKTLMANATQKQSERIEVLLQSLDTRGTDIMDLEKKIEELLSLNMKLREVNKSKTTQILDLEKLISGFEEEKKRHDTPEKILLLNKQITVREGQIDELEVKLSESTSVVNRLKRTMQAKDEKLGLLEQKLQDLDELIHQKEKLSHIADERSKKIIDIETKLDILQNENTKLHHLMKQKDADHQVALKNLSTLESSITDHSSLSKLVQMRDGQVTSLNSQIENKDEKIIDLEAKLSEQESRYKKVAHSLKLKDEQLSELEQISDKYDELVSTHSKLRSSLAQKDSKIHELEDSLDELGELSRQNKRLKDNIKTKESKISSLEQRLDDLEEAVNMNERLNQQVQQKEERIATLQERIKDLENQLHKAEQRVELVKKNAENEISKLAQQNDEMSEVKVQRQMSIMRRDQKITNLESRLNEYANEQQQKDSEIQQLQSKLEGTLSQYRRLDMSQEEKDAKLQDLEARVKELEDTYTENRRLSRNLQKKEDELVKLRKIVADLESYKKENIALLTNKESNFNELQNRLDETLALNNRLNSSIKKQEEKIRSLEKVVVEKENMYESISNEHLSKERTLTRNVENLKHLQNELGDKEKKIFDLEKRLTLFSSYEEEKAGLLQQIKEKEQLLLNAQNKLAIHEESLNEKAEGIIQLKDEQINKLQAKNDELLSEKHRSKLNSQEKDGIIVDLEQRVEELELTVTDSDKLNSIVKEKNAQIKILRQNVDDYQSSIVQLETKVDELTSELNRANLALKQKDERLNAIKNQLESQRNQYFTVNNELKMQEEKLKSLTKSLSESEERNKELEEDINMLEKDLQDLKSTGSLKNITNITEKIQLTKRARTELHIQRGPRMQTNQPPVQKIEIKMSPTKADGVSTETREMMARLQEENECLEKQKSYLSDRVETLSHENAELLSSNESLQSSFDLLKVDYEEIQKEMIEAKEHFQELDISATKIAHRCEVLVQLNATLEEENKALMDQVNKLLSQNQELLVTTLQSREQYLDEERAFSDHIYGLEREKEKLSEKVLAAEKALLDSSSTRKKNALWRGTHKILKKAGLAKKRDANVSTTSMDTDAMSEISFGSAVSSQAQTSIPPDNINSPLGPIRGIISRSRQDLTKIDNEVSMRRPSGLSYAESIASDSSNKSRPKSDFYPQYRMGEMGSPVETANELHELHRTNSLETITSNERRLLNDMGETSGDIVPLKRQESFRSEHSSAASVSSNPQASVGARTPKTRSGNSTPRLSRRSNDESQPIQKVLVTQSVTPKVMKASPETLNLDNVSRQILDESPRSSRKAMRPSSAVSNAPTYVTPKKPVAQVNSSTPLNHIRQANIKNLDDSFEGLNNRRNINRRQSGPDNLTENTFVSARSRSEEDYDGSFSPISPPPNPVSPPSTPFGTRELRSSFRRYEIEQMEPRPLPSGSMENIIDTDDTSPRRTSLTRKISDKIKNSEMFYGSNENRYAPREEHALKRTNSERRKKNSSWYEYGNV